MHRATPKPERVSGFGFRGRQRLRRRQRFWRHHHHSRFSRECHEEGINDDGDDDATSFSRTSHANPSPTGEALRLCCADMAHLREPEPDFGLGFQIKDLEAFQVVPSSLERGTRGRNVRAFAKREQLEGL